MDWLLRVLRVDGLVDVTQTVDPVSISAATRKLKRHLTKLKAEIATSRRAGRYGVNNLEKLVNDIEWFLDLLADQECTPVRYGTYITVHGATREEVQETFEQVISQLRVLGLEVRQPGYRNDHAYCTDSVFYPDRLDETFLMPSLSASSGFPFGTQPLEAENGVLYGFDVEDGTPILLDRFSWSSHSMTVTGILGSGKSYTAHLELMRSMLVYPDLRLIVLDPKKEYGSTVKALGGESRLIDQGNEYNFDRDIISFEPRERGEFENVTAFVELLDQVYSKVSKDQRKTLVLVDEAHNILDDDRGRAVLRQLVLESRDCNIAVHMISQSASHFTKYQEGKEILKEVVGELFFREKEVSDSMIDYYRLSDEKIWRLKNLRIGEDAGIGEALLHVNDVIDTRIRIPSTDLEHRVIENSREQGLEVVR
ncbi:uncharacterized protein DUF87 [Halopiger aswanensis]|uniref:Uncharacterized protein DUF87 n=2 Tax=Halopiger aswanensis TaxID=148449 RepID=A0A3R7GWE4_9EURY|nr:uncharacterized protein DUF87 [Halopiger aswanensis]